jgi:hypothetical protein
MRKPTDPVWTMIIIYMLLVVLIIGCSMLFSSCQVLKTKRAVKSDSTAVAKVDSGKITINTNNTKDSLAWWREIVNFGRDTTIVVSPTNNIYPTSYIREGGVRTTESKSVNYDSLWNNRFDSLSYRLLKEDKSKETKVLTQWYIWVILGLVGLIAFKLFFKLK